MEENRSFDSFLGTYPHADGIPMKHGVPTVCVPNGVGQCATPFLDRNGLVDSGGAPDRWQARRTSTAAAWTGSSGSPTGGSSVSAAATGAARRATACATPTS
jgi:phospholipase C